MSHRRPAGGSIRPGTGSPATRSHCPAGREPAAPTRPPRPARRHRGRLSAWHRRAALPGTHPGVRRAGVLVQYGYRVDLPEGWEHTGGLPERRRVLLTRVGGRRAPTHRGRAHPARLRLRGRASPGGATEMRAVFDGCRRERRFPATARPRVGGRSVTSCRPRDGPARRRVVRRARRRRPVSVGCRHTRQARRGAGGVRRRRRIGPARLSSAFAPANRSANRHEPPVPGATVYPTPARRDARGGGAVMAVDGFGATTEEMARAASTWPGSTRPCRASSPRCAAGWRRSPGRGSGGPPPFAQLMVRWDTDARSLNQALAASVRRSRGRAPISGRRTRRRESIISTRWAEGEER